MNARSATPPVTVQPGDGGSDEHQRFRLVVCPYLSARLAAGASLLSWLLGGLMSFLIALVFAELGALVSSSGALAQIPLLTHGRSAGFLGGGGPPGWATWAYPPSRCWPPCNT